MEQVTVIQAANSSAEDLFEHPNFEIPDIAVRLGKGIEKRDPFIEGAAWALEAAARLISPAKESDEDQSFACEDIADVLRNQLFFALCQKMNDTRGD